MEKEAYSDPIKIRRQQRISASKKNLGKAFLPADGEKGNVILKLFDITGIFSGCWTGKLLWNSTWSR